MSKNRLTRRDFLRMSGAAGAALAGASPLGNLAKVAAQSDATINVLTVGDPWDLALQSVVDQFTEATGIGVNIESLGYTALQARLVNAFLTQSADADVIAVDQMWISQYADNGWIRSLDDFIAMDSDANFDDFLPECLYSLSTWRNHVWTLPIASYAQGIMYRTDLFEAAGLDPLPASVADAGNWTWADYFGILEQINGMDLDGTSMYGTTVIGAQPVPVVHMYTQLAASYGTRWFSQFPEAPWDFSQGDIGMFYHWTPYFYLVNNEGYLTGSPSPVVDKFETAVLPTVTAGGDQVVSLGGWSLGMPSTSANQDAAWQFIKWATGSEGQKAMGQVNVKGHQFADFSRKSNYADADLNALYPFLSTQLEMMKLGDGKVVRPPAPIYTSLEGVYGLQINQAMTGAVTPEQALATTQTLFQNILSGNQMIPYGVESFDDTLDNTKALIASLSGM